MGCFDFLNVWSKDIKVFNSSKGVIPLSDFDHFIFEKQLCVCSARDGHIFPRHFEQVFRNLIKRNYSLHTVRKCTLTKRDKAKRAQPCPPNHEGLIDVRHGANFIPQKPLAKYWRLENTQSDRCHPRSRFTDT